MDLPTSMRSAMEKLPGLQADREQIEKQNIQLKYNFNQLFPRLDLVASWGVNGLDPHLSGALHDLDHMDFQNDGYGLALSFPFTMMRERNNYKAAKLVKEQLLLKLKSDEEIVIFDVDAAVRNVMDAYRRIGLSREGVGAAERYYQAQQQVYAVGKTTSFFVLDAATKLADARNKEIQARVDYNKALNDLARAEGTILEQRKVDFEAVRYPPARD